MWHSCEHREWACPAMQSIKKKTKSSRHYLGSRNFSDWFHIGWNNMSGQGESSRSLYIGLTPPFSSTSWRTLLEFLILWRPSFPDPYKNISSIGLPWVGPFLNSFFSFIGVGVAVEVALHRLRLSLPPMWGIGRWRVRVGSRAIGWVSLV